MKGEVRRFLVALSLLLLFLTGCGGSDPYKHAFKKESPNMKVFPYPLEETWTAVVRAALAHNFTIEKEDSAARLLQASRYYQKGKRMVQLLLTVSVQPVEDGRSAVYVNAVQRAEKLYVKKEYWKLLIIPTPFTKSKEATLAKEEEKTIEDKRFYRDFFRAVEKELNRTGG